MQYLVSFRPFGGKKKEQMVMAPSAGEAERQVEGEIVDIVRLPAVGELPEGIPRWAQRLVILPRLRAGRPGTI